MAGGGDGLGDGGGEVVGAELGDRRARLGQRRELVMREQEQGVGDLPGGDDGAGAVCREGDFLVPGGQAGGDLGEQAAGGRARPGSPTSAAVIRADADTW